MEGRVALVTGASRGLGRATALELAKAGATVIATARTEGGLSDLDDEARALGLPPLVLAPLDLTDFSRIDQMAALIAARFGRLDALVSAAATLGGLGPMAHFDPDLFERVIATDLTAQWRTLRACDPLLRLSDAGRVAFVTSAAARLAPAYWGAYAIAKAGLEAMVRTYAAEIARTPIRANLFDPGALATRMRAEAFPGEDAKTLPTPEAVAPPSPPWRCPPARSTANGAGVKTSRALPGPAKGLGPFDPVTGSSPRKRLSTITRMRRLDGAPRENHPADPPSSPSDLFHPCPV
jgi:NAD(P)-dependent dehydrogenase (short-subunit alcohol dehydrogenase family)